MPAANPCPGLADLTLTPRPAHFLDFLQFLQRGCGCHIFTGQLPRLEQSSSPSPLHLVNCLSLILQASA